MTYQFSPFQNLFMELSLNVKVPTDQTTATAIAVVDASLKAKAAAIIVLTTTGRSAYSVARFRPRCPIITVTRNARVARQSHLYRGILPLPYDQARLDDWTADVDARVSYATEFGKKRGFIQEGDCVIVVTGWRRGAGATNTMRLITA